MASYTHEYSKFPEQIVGTGTYKDVTNSMASIINQIKSLQNAGDYAAAATLIANNPSVKDCIIDASVINALIEENRNAEIYAKKAKQSIYVQDTEPSTPIDEDVWIGV